MQHNKTFKCQKQKEKLKSSKTKRAWDWQGNSLRQSADFWAQILQPEEVESYIQSAERKKAANQKRFTCKAAHQKGRSDKDFLRQTKVEEIHYY